MISRFVTSGCDFFFTSGYDTTKKTGWIFGWNIFLTFKNLRQVTWFWILFSTFGNPTFMKFTGSGKPKLSHLKWSAENFFNVCTSKLKLVPNHFLRRRTKHTQNLTPWFYIFIFFSHNDTVVDAPKFEIFPHNLSILWVFLNQNLLICSSPTWIFMCKFFQNIFCVQNWLSFAVNSTKHLIF